MGKFNDAIYDVSRQTEKVIAEFKNWTESFTCDTVWQAFAGTAVAGGILSLIPGFGGVTQVRDHHL